jgi:hypothetical protein
VARTKLRAQPPGGGSSALRSYTIATPYLHPIALGATGCTGQFEWGKQGGGTEIGRIHTTTPPLLAMCRFAFWEVLETVVNHAAHVRSFSVPMNQTQAVSFPVVIQLIYRALRQCTHAIK